MSGDRSELEHDLESLRMTNRALELEVQRLERCRHELLARQMVLERRATTDVLTGVKNRQGFQDSVMEMIAFASRNGTQLSLLLLDVDRFKQINDTSGHHVGDEVLVAVARILTSRIRRQDIVARYGGDEFAVLLPNTDVAAAVTVAENLRIDCRSAGNSGSPFTVSIGVVSRQNGDDAALLVRRADRALYAAKARGRDATATAPAAPSGGAPGASSDGARAVPKGLVVGPDS